MSNDGHPPERFSRKPQTEVEELLRKDAQRTFLASEVAHELKISRSSAHRQLRKLVAKGRVIFREGRYSYSPGPPSRASLEERIDGLSRLTGISRGTFEAWVDEEKEKRRMKQSEGTT